MKISISTGSFYFLSFDRTLKIFKKAGFKNIEVLGYWKDGDWEVGQNVMGLSLKELKQKVLKAGLEISTFHDPSGVIYSDSDDVVLSTTSSLINKKDFPWIITHLPYRSANNDNWWKHYRDKAANQYKNLSINNNLCLENMAPIENYKISITNSDELYKFCDEVGAFINLDMIHVLQNGQDLRQVILSLNDKIKNVHISGYSTDGRVHFEKSEIDILGYLKYLDFNVLNAITIETSFDHKIDNDDVYIEQCKVLRKQLEGAIKSKKNSKIPFSLPTFVGKELSYIRDSIEKGKISGDGFYTQKCKEWFRKNYKSEYTVITTSCTHALELAASICEISCDDEVIVPSFTFTATANAYVNAGAKIKFIDIKPNDMNINEDLIEKAITNKTKAIVVVHYAGFSCNMDKIIALARKYNLFVIEDAAQAILCEYKGRKLGTIGDVGCFSFHATKNITMGEGGAVIVNNRKLISKAIYMSDNGIDRRNFLIGKEERYHWVGKGASYKASDINSAYLFAQLEVAQNIINKRIKMWKLYLSLLEELELREFIQLPKESVDTKHNGHIFFIKNKNEQINRQLKNYLNTKAIVSTYHYTPLHSTLPGNKYGEMIGRDVYTSKESGRLLRLPIYHEIKKSDILRVVKAIYDFYGVDFNVA